MHTESTRPTTSSLPSDVSKLGISSRRPPGVKAHSSTSSQLPVLPVLPRLSLDLPYQVKSAYLPAALPVSCKCMLRS